MIFQIGAVELRRALKDIEAAEANGFMHCLAIFDPARVDGVCVRLRYSDIHERAHPTDGRFDWGRCQGVTRRHQFRNGRLVELPKTDDAVGKR